MFLLTNANYVIKWKNIEIKIDNNIENNITKKRMLGGGVNLMLV